MSDRKSVSFAESLSLRMIYSVGEYKSNGFTSLEKSARFFLRVLYFLVTGRKSDPFSIPPDMILPVDSIYPSVKKLMEEAFTMPSDQVLVNKHSLYLSLLKRTGQFIDLDVIQKYHTTSDEKWDEFVAEAVAKSPLLRICRTKTIALTARGCPPGGILPQ
jgi:hypothetical protein